MNFLTEILQIKKQEVAQLRQSTSREALIEQGTMQPPIVPFLSKPTIAHELRLIAEVKKSSPSKGDIQAQADPASVASYYDQGGADAISVLTDRQFFAGSNEDFLQVRAVTRKPLLRKDFIIDEWQVYEARAIGADAILLIAAILEKDRISSLYELAQELGMAVLIEVHHQDELEIVKAIEHPRYIGINNRDLHNFHVNMATTGALVPLVQHLFPDAMIISESGITTSEDAKRAHFAGAHGLLVGEFLMRKGLDQVNEAIVSLKGTNRIGLAQ